MENNSEKEKEKLYPKGLSLQLGVNQLGVTYIHDSDNNNTLNNKAISINQ